MAHALSRLARTGAALVALGLFSPAMAAEPAAPVSLAANAAPATPAAAQPEAESTADEPALATARGPLQAVYGTQQIPLAFDHAKHLAKKAKCEDCHDMAKSARPADRNLPPERTCLDCHDVTEEAPEKADPPAACATCHPGYAATFPEGVSHDETEKASPHPAPVVFPTPSIVFSHQAHLSRGAKCEACHRGVEAVGLATVRHLPMMADCMECHDGDRAPATCATCHVSRRDGVLETSLPGGKLVPRGLYRNDDHRGDFARTHGPAAKADADYCRACHTESECGRCHTGNVKPLTIHAADYILTHAPEARRDDPQCGKCHRRQTFCVDCHLRSGLSPNFQAGGLEYSARGGVRHFHPEGFMNYAGPPSPEHHMYEARRNLRACASCHQESYCTTCHSVQTGAAKTATTGVNPHPPGWERDCKRAMDRNATGCLKCHGSRADLEMRCDD